MSFLVFDRQAISTQRVYTDEGYLKVPARVARTGTQVYLAKELGITDRDPNEVVVAYRPPEEVFAEDSMKSFATKPITNNHPPVLVDSTNSKQYAVGMTGPDVTQDGEFMDLELMITDSESIADVESGKSELSNGYSMTLDHTPGVSPEGEKYDVIQRNIRGNHVAIVKRARAGRSCRVADSKPQDGDKMKVIIDGVEFEVTDQVAQAVGKLQKRVVDAEASTEEAKKEVDDKEKEMVKKGEEATATADALQAKLDSATAKIPTADSMDKLITARSEFTDKVRAIDSAFAMDGKDEATVRRELVMAKCPGVKDSVSDTYIEVRFDMLADSEASTDPLSIALSDTLTKDGEKTDGRTLDQIARDNMIADSQDAWKTPKEDK